MFCDRDEQEFKYSLVNAVIIDDGGLEINSAKTISNFMLESKVLSKLLHDEQDKAKIKSSLFLKRNN